MGLGGPVAGASRVLDMSWPFADSVYNNNNGRVRGGQVIANWSKSQVGGAAGEVTAISKGAPCAQYNSPGVGSGWINGFADGQGWMTERPVTAVAVPDDYRCWSLRAILNFDAATGAVVGDVGLLINPGNRNQTFWGTGQAGVCFGPTNNGEVSLRAKRASGGAQTIAEVSALTPDIREWNEYELRILGATNSVDCTLQGFINRIPATAKYSWSAAAALLPNPDDGGAGFKYFTPRVVCMSGGLIANMRIRRAQLVAAPDEFYLL